jgi:hypothetical protein
MVDYKCFKCNKIFNSPSKLERHKNNKLPCNKIKEDLKCNLCNVIFTRPSHKNIHEKTKKHINNVKQSNINGDNINQIGNNNSINFQNIINLTLQTKPFNETDLSYLRKWIIEDISNDLYIKTIKKEYLSIQDKVKSLFRGLLEILEQLHFNLNNEDNHNCKILLMFPGFKKPIYEYLILEIETNTNKISWKSLSYDDFIKELLNHLTKMNEPINNENFEKYIYYLKKYLINDEDIANEMKPFIENKLSDLYINFNTKQKKESRPIKITLEEKIKEYIDYRNQETRLHNGFNPKIINSQIN